MAASSARFATVSGCLSLMVLIGLILGLLHVADDARRKLAGSYFGCACSLALEVVGHEFLLDGFFHRIFNELGGFFPADEVEEHDAGEDDGTGIDDILVGVLGSCAVGGFEDGKAIADVG